MANNLLSRTVRTQGKRMAGDMAYRSDLLLQPEIFTQIVRQENPGSVLSFFGLGVGDYETIGAPGNPNTDKMFTLEAGGLSSSFINIKEESEKYEAIRVTGNSRVPGTINANQSFEFEADKAWMDMDENFLLRDERSFGRVISRRLTPNGIGGNTGCEYTVQIAGLPGQQFDGTYLFEMNAPINFGYGNSQGEGSKKSNTIPDHANQYNSLFNPMAIMRYELPMTGSYMSEETFYTIQQTALDGSVSEFNTGLSKRWLRRVLQSWEGQLLYSTANFDPITKQILGINPNAVRYNERPLFAGIYQQLDMAPIRWTIGMREGMVAGAKKVRRIMQTITQEMPGASKKIVAMCTGIGAEWLRQVIQEGGLALYPVNIQREIGDDDMLTVGFKVDRFVTAHGELYIYDVGNARTRSGEFDQYEFEGITGSGRSKDIYFFSTTRSGTDGRPARKVAKYFAKEGQVDGMEKVSRGFVFGISNGITGKGTGMTAQQSLALDQSNMMDQMMRNSSRYSVNSTTDGDEYHALVEGTVYIDARGTVKLSLI